MAKEKKQNENSFENIKNKLDDKRLNKLDNLRPVLSEESRKEIEELKQEKIFIKDFLRNIKLFEKMKTEYDSDNIKDEYDDKYFSTKEGEYKKKKKKKKKNIELLDLEPEFNDSSSESKPIIDETALKNQIIKEVIKEVQKIEYHEIENNKILINGKLENILNDLKEYGLDRTEIDNILSQKIVTQAELLYLKSDINDLKPVNLKEDKPITSEKDKNTKPVNLKEDKPITSEKDIDDNKNEMLKRIKVIDEKLENFKDKTNTTLADSKKKFIDITNAIKDIRARMNPIDLKTIGLGIMASEAVHFGKNLLNNKNNNDLIKEMPKIVNPVGYSSNISKPEQQAMSLTNFIEQGSSTPKWNYFSEKEVNPNVIFNVGTFNYTLGKYTKEDKSAFEWGSLIDFFKNVKSSIDSNKDATPQDKTLSNTIKVFLNSTDERRTKDLPPTEVQIDAARTISKAILSTPYSQLQQEQTFKNKYQSIKSRLDKNKNVYNVDTEDSGLMAVLSSTANRYGEGGLFSILDSMVKKKIPINIDSLNKEKQDNWSNKTAGVKPARMREISQQETMLGKNISNKLTPLQQFIGGDNNATIINENNEVVGAVTPFTKKYENATEGIIQERIDDLTPESRAIYDEHMKLSSTEGKGVFENIRDMAKIIVKDDKTLTTKSGEKTKLSDFANTVGDYKRNIEQADKKDVNRIEYLNKEIEKSKGSNDKLIVEHINNMKSEIEVLSKNINDRHATGIDKKAPLPDKMPDNIKSNNGKGSNIN